jgi:hypothetical protein
VKAFTQRSPANAALVDVIALEREVGVGGNRALLRLQNVSIFEKDAALLPLETGSETRIVLVEAARHAPEIMHAGLALGRRKIDDETPHALIVSLERRARVHWRYADIDNNRRGRDELADLPTVDQTLLLQRAAPEWRRVDAGHPARDIGPVAFNVHLDRRLHKFGLADRAGMDVRFVCQVHQIVDHQPVIGRDGIIAAVEHPAFRRTGPQIWNQGFVRSGALPHPHPDEAMPLGDGKGFGANAGVHPVGAQRHLLGHAVRAELEPVIATPDRIALAQAER